MNPGAELGDYIRRRGEQTGRRTDLPETAASDLQLLRWIAQAGAAAFDELYSRYHVALYNFLLRTTQSPAAADELLQEVFIAVWQRAGSFEGRSSVKTWLFRIASNQAMNWIKIQQKDRRQTWLDESEDQLETSPDDAPETVFFSAWEAERIVQAVRQLAPIHREVIELCFAHGFSYKEMAVIASCPVGTIKSRMSHALRQLARLLARDGFLE